MAGHPYQHIGDHQFWKRAVTWAPPGGLDPVVHTRYSIGPDDSIGTLGSCFAQHLARHLARSGIRYFVPEAAPEGMSPQEAQRRQYGVFSARYGNVYTVRQAVQLVERAFGDFVPVEEPWERGEVLVDPFRPTVEPDGFVDAPALLADRERHLAAVRRVFSESSVLVFTLGLTEAWRSRSDGAVFATAPGVNGGEWDPERYEFVNFDIDEVRGDLRRWCDLVRSVNPRVRVLLTVSPVPLIATYEDRHVLVSTNWSKSVLRVAAEDAYQAFDFVDYFPSYELISAATAPRNYFAPDLREVTDVGVAHVMRSFTRHYLHGRRWTLDGVGEGVANHGNGATPEPGAEPGVVCDEETIAAAIEASR